jgi:hypothetical protein
MRVAADPQSLRGGTSPSWGNANPEVWKGVRPRFRSYGTAEVRRVARPDTLCFDGLCCPELGPSKSEGEKLAPQAGGSPSSHKVQSTGWKW